MRTAPAAILILIYLLMASTGPAIATTQQDATPPPPFSHLEFGMSARAASNAQPQAKRLTPGVNFGHLKGRLVIPEMEAFGSGFRVYLQFDSADMLRQILLERRHAAATRKSAGNIQQYLTNDLGEPDEICLPHVATPAAARVTWRKENWSLHLIGFDDLGLGIRTQDADRGDPLEIKPLGRSRAERLRSRQQSSLPRRILIRIHDADDQTLEPPACG